MRRAAALYAANAEGQIAPGFPARLFAVDGPRDVSPVEDRLRNPHMPSKQDAASYRVSAPVRDRRGSSASASA